MPETRHAYEHVSGIFFPIAIGVFALLVLVLIGLLIAGRVRNQPGRRSEALKVEIPYAFLLAGIAAFMVWTTFTAENPIDRLVARPGLRVHVVAAQWSWQFTYPTGKMVTAIASWHPPRAYVPTNTEVEFIGTSRDVLHGFWVPRLRFMRQMIPGEQTRFDLIFRKPGLYEGECSVFCGMRHDEMHFALQAVSLPRFEHWMQEAGSVQ